MLPNIEINYYNTILPYSKKKFNFKPFTVKDQKNFLINKESNENFDIYDYLYSLTKNCCVEDIDTLIKADFDYLFFQIRKYSVGNEIDINFTYDIKEQNFSQDISDKLKIDEDLKIKKEYDINKIIEYNKYKLYFEALTIDNYIKFKNNDDIGFLIASMLKKIETKEKTISDFSIEDAKDFIETLLPEIEYKKIITFYINNPSIYFDKQINLTNGDKLELKNREFTDFF